MRHITKIISVLFGLCVIPQVFSTLSENPELQSVLIHGNSNSDFSEKFVQSSNSARIKANCVIRQAKVVGGTEADIAAFPYVVAILEDHWYGQELLCGGSLIADQWILTAAHCIKGFTSVATLIINVGDHNLLRNNETEHQIRRVLKGLYHSGYNNSAKEHDIALLKLDKPVIVGGNVQTVCLSDAEPPIGANAVVAGWGHKGSTQTSSTLQIVTIKILDNGECKEIYNGGGVAFRSPKITDNMICAGEKNSGKDSCEGDSGGPLVMVGDNVSNQIGIVSWGMTGSCGDYPGVYSRVSRYISWMQSNLKAH